MRKYYFLIMDLKRGANLKERVIATQITGFVLNFNSILKIIKHNIHQSKQKRK